MKKARKWRVRFEWKVQDVWFGVFWKRTQCAQTFGEFIENVLDVWVCLLPMVPLHITRTDRIDL